MHYYNPSLDTGVMDSSGVRVTFASSLRPHDAAGGIVEGRVEVLMRRNCLFSFWMFLVVSVCLVFFCYCLVFFLFLFGVFLFLFGVFLFLCVWCFFDVCFLCCSSVVSFLGRNLIVH